MTKLKLRGDSAANLKATNPILDEREPIVDMTNGIIKVGDGKTPYNSIDKYMVSNKEMEYTKLCDRLYDGVDLTIKFALEIANYASPWAWIQARIKANNFDGIHVGDYIPFVLSAGTVAGYNITQKTLNAQISGIDTYYGYGDVAVGHHIDFITTRTIGTNMQWNPTDNNNGTSENQNPWLASKLYACLNGVNNYSTNAYNSVAHGVDASAGGVLQLLPGALQNVIIQKRLYAPTRYSATSILTESTSAAWLNMGKLWLPTEFEVCGAAICSGGGKDVYGVDRNICGTPVQYPLFNGSNSYRNNLNKGRVTWWFSSVVSGASTRACISDGTGYATANYCANAGISAPVCFRIG